MKRSLAVLATACTLLPAVPSSPQEAGSAPKAESSPGPAKTRPVWPPLQVQVTLSRYQGDKKTGSLPYTLQVAMGTNVRSTSLRMGVEVPVPVTTFKPASGSKSEEGGSPATSVQYRNVGTNMDCKAEPLDDGRFRLDLMVEQSAVVPATEAAPEASSGLPFFRTFNIFTPVILRDGQSTQYVAASDPVTGESVRIDVTLKVLK